MVAAKRPTQFTIGRIMVAIAVVALVIGLLTQSDGARFLFVVLSQLILFIGLPTLFIHYLVTRSIGVGCPNCGQHALERRALASFGPRFYRCTACGLRCKRVTFGGWEDASGAEFDAIYQRKVEDDPWSAPPGLEDEDLIYSKTHVNLVRNKRRRNPDDPNGPGLE